MLTFLLTIAAIAAIASIGLVALLLMAKFSKQPVQKNYGYLHNDSCPINLKDLR